MHLQCHIGTDTVSLARLGASMTGLDFSGPAVGQARSLAARIGADARFVQADVYYGLMRRIVRCITTCPAGITSTGS